MSEDPHARPGPRTAEDLRQGQDSAPSRWADLRRAVLYGLGLAVTVAVLYLLAKTGLLRTQNRSRIDPDASWAGILMGTFGAMWPYMLISTSRDDLGFRRRGLAAVLVPAAVIVSLGHLVVVALLSLLVGDEVPADAVLATVLDDPIALLTVGAFVLTVHAWCAVCTIGFIRLGAVRVAVSLIAFFVIAGLCVWRGIVMLEEPPSADALLVWGVLGALGLVALALAALVDELLHDKTPAA